VHGVVVHLEAGVDEFRTVLLHVREDRAIRRHVDAELVGEVRGHLEHLPLGVLVVRVPHQCLHLDKVDHALEVVLGADRDLHRQRARAEALPDHVHAAREVGAAAVHLVDVADARHAVVVGETPVGLGLRLDTGDTVKHHHGAVQHAQRAIHLDGEIDVPGGVDQVDLLAAPEAGDRGALDRDAALLFLLQIVRGRRGLQILGVMDVDDRVLASRVIQDALRRRRFAGIDVGDDADVADIRKSGSTGHGKFPFRVSGSHCRAAGQACWPPLT
jgi:hypothetical protein